MNEKSSSRIKSLNSIPKNGRIGRFAKMLLKEAGEETLLKVMQDCDRYQTFKPAEKALWWKSAVDKMERELGRERAAAVMHACGEKCCGMGQRSVAKKLMSESGSIEEFLAKLSSEHAGDGELDYRLVDEHTIIGRYNKCFCGQVKKTKESFPNDTYCQCTVEFNRQFFQAAFDKEVKVELKKSIISGGDSCEFVITF